MDLPSLIFIIFFMLSINVKLTLMCMCGLPVLALFASLIKKKQHRAWQIQSNKQSNLNAYIAESINGIRVTQSFVREKENSGIFNRLSDGYRQSWMRAVRFNFMMGPTVDVISAVTTAFLYVAIVDMAMSGGTASVGTDCLYRLYQPFRVSHHPHWQTFYNSPLTAISYLERIFETIDEPVAVMMPLGAVEMPLSLAKFCDHVSSSPTRRA